MTLAFSNANALKFFSLCAFEADIEAEVYTLSSNSWKKIGISLRLNNIESYFVMSTSTTSVSGLCIGWVILIKLKDNW